MVPSIPLFVPGVVLAEKGSVIITEIMYDPIGRDGGHEWIEVYNASPSAIPFTTWKIYEGDTNHSISGSSTSALLPGSYAIVANNTVTFRADYPGFLGSLFHASFSLSNSTDALVLRDASLTNVDSVSYSSALGGKGDGNSLQRLPSATEPFVARPPSPGGVISPQAVTKPVVIDVPHTPPVAPASTSAVPSSKPKTNHIRRSRYTSHAIADSAPVPPLSPIHSPDLLSQAKKDAEQSNIPTNSQIASGGNVALGVNYGWYGALALILLSVGAVVASRHFKKTEWDIVEEHVE